MADKQHFYRYGRYCPVDCPNKCCVICAYSAGAIEFIPTRPVFSCRHEGVEEQPKHKKGEGRYCPHFFKADIPKHARMVV
jgi:hypothetical protein